MDIIKKLVGILNSEFNTYNYSTVTDWNKAKAIIEYNGIPEKLSASIATDYGNYRTNVLDYSTLIEVIEERLRPYKK